MKKHILVINTGGTISSIKVAKGYEPAPDQVLGMLSRLPAMSHPEMPRFTLLEYSPLLDSSNIGEKEWNQIASDIAKNYHNYDGFVILHGTDTMAYTASILSFTLENLNKPVIITGSQIPLSEARNDAADNVTTSLWISANRPLNEVCIYFNQRLLRGNRAKKVSAQAFNAFDSPNFPPLASIGVTIDLNVEALLPTPAKLFNWQPTTPQFIANFQLFPGVATEVLGYLLKQPLRGLILETYGAGNAKNNDPLFLGLLREACQQGIVIVNCTQCQHGYVKMDEYATGYSLLDAGIVSGHDMTSEAAHCKLLYLLSKYNNPHQIRELMGQNLCGELTPIKRNTYK
jgi:L-asparaginase